MSITWGMTSSQVSTSTSVNPAPIAWLTSSWAPYLNHSVSRRRVSCKAFSFLSEIERKKPVTADTIWAASSFPGTSLILLYC